MSHFLFGRFSRKKLKHNFPKMREAVKGSLEFFRKFIRFGALTHPLALSEESIWGRKSENSGAICIRKLDFEYLADIHRRTCRQEHTSTWGEEHTRTQKHLRRRADVASSRSDLSLGASSGGIWGSSSSGSDYSSGSRENIVESSLWLKLPSQE